MFKSVIAATAAAPLFAGAAIAGPYVNVETNSSFNGGGITKPLLIRLSALRSVGSRSRSSKVAAVLASSKAFKVYLFE